MSKTIEEIGLIVGGLALALVAGPLGIIVLQGNVAAFQAMVGIGVTAALSGVGQLLRPTPKTVGTANTLSFNNGPAPRRCIYGQFQTAGVLSYSSFPPAENQNIDQQRLHLVYTLTGHEISSFDAIAINGSFYNFGCDLIWGGTYWVVKPDNSSVLDDFYWTSIEMTFDAGRTGLSSQTLNNPFPELAAVDSSWTSAFQQRGCAKVHVVLSYSQGWPYVFQSGNIPNIQFLVTGKKLIDPRVTTAWAPSSSYPNYAYILDDNGFIFFQQTAGTQTSGSSRPAFESNEAAGDTLTDGGCTWYCTGQSIQNVYEYFYWSGGGANGPAFFDGVLVNDGWPPQTGRSSTPNQWVIEAPIGYLQMQTGGSGSTGSSHPNFSTILGGTTSDGGFTWTCLGRSTRAINPSNSALCVNDYLQDSDAGLQVNAATIDTSSVIAAANVCEEQVLIIWNADNTVVYENLYSCNGMFDQSSHRGDVLTSLCGSMAGWCVCPGDFWHVFAGAYVTPTLAYTDNDLRESIKGDFRLSRRDIANSIKGRYVPAYLPTNPSGALSLTQIPGTWQVQSFPAYQANGLAGKPNYLNSEDGGQIIWQEIQLDFTTSLWTAQRLAKIVLMRLRFQETLTLPLKLTALQLEAGDTFAFTHARWGLLASSFEAQQVSIHFDDRGSGGKDTSPVVGIDVIARQTDPSIYTFAPPSSSTNFGEYSPFGVTGVMTGVE